MTLIAADLANLYPAHLASLQQHYLDAAMLAGAAGVVIAAGALQPCFLDDSHYPLGSIPTSRPGCPLRRCPIASC